jgi:hypothetical protein
MEISFPRESKVVDVVYFHQLTVPQQIRMRNNFGVKNMFKNYAELGSF